MSQTKAQEAKSTVRFSSELSAENELALPKEAMADLSLSGKTTVEGTIQGFPFRAPTEGGTLFLTEAQRKSAGIEAGEMARIEVTRLEDEPEVRVPADFRKALATVPKVEALFENITPMARREWVRWIASAKQEKTRERRIEVAIDKLSKGMRRPCCFPGLNFVTKDLVTPDETWGPLPKLDASPN